MAVPTSGSRGGAEVPTVVGQRAGVGGHVFPHGMHQFYALVHDILAGRRVCPAWIRYPYSLDLEVVLAIWQLRSRRVCWPAFWLFTMPMTEGTLQMLHLDRRMWPLPPYLNPPRQRPIQPPRFVSLCDTVPRDSPARQ